MELPKLKIKHNVKDMAESFGISEARVEQAEKKMFQIFEKGLRQKGYNESHAIQEMYNFCNDTQEVACFLWLLSKRIIIALIEGSREE